MIRCQRIFLVSKALPRMFDDFTVKLFTGLSAEAVKSRGQEGA